MGRVSETAFVTLLAACDVAGVDAEIVEHRSCFMRWVIVAMLAVASAGLIAVGVSMNFAFGSSFGRTPLESYAYGAAFGFADILKVVAPIVAARSFGNRKW